jgi:hypothetical protein
MKHTTETVAGEMDLRLVVIRPVGYRLRSGARKLYTQPAYLICTDPLLALEDLLQEYIWRWDIEVNHRDEKTILGVGQAQVRNENSVQHIPALAVAAYAKVHVSRKHRICAQLASRSGVGFILFV